MVLPCSNNALAPLWSPELGINNSLVNAERVVFVNDVHFCQHDIVRLLQHDADIVCGLDLYAAPDHDARPDAWNSTYSKLWCAQTVWSCCTATWCCTTAMLGRLQQVSQVYFAGGINGRPSNAIQQRCNIQMTSCLPAAVHLFSCSCPAGHEVAAKLPEQ